MHKSEYFITGESLPASAAPIIVLFVVEIVNKKFAAKSLRLGLWVDFMYNL